MNDVIQCPTCSKKYKLPANPPPTFTCKQCSTVMDLSGFAPVPPAAAVPAPPLAPAPSRRSTAAAEAEEETPSRARRGARAGGRSSARGRGAAAGRRGRGREEEYEEDDGAGRGRRQKKGPSPMIWVAAAGGLVVIAVVAILLMNRDKGEDGGGARKGEVAVSPGAGTPGAGTTPPAPGVPAAPGGTAPAPGAGAPGGTSPAPGGAEPGAAAPAAPPKSTAPTFRPDQAEIKEYPYPSEVTAEEQQKIEQAMVDAVETGGKDGLNAEKFLVEMKYKAAGRIVSEFKRIKDKHGLESPDALKRALVVDRMLRKIDGVQERKFKDPMPINYASDPNQALATVRRWNWWWATEEWKKNPQKPWNPAEDEADEPTEK